MTHPIANPITKSILNSFDIKDNHEAIETAVAVCRSLYTGSALSPIKPQQVVLFLEKFIHDHNITMKRNLLESEETALYNIIYAAFRFNLKTDEQKLLNMLSEWKEKLVHAVAGRGLDIPLYQLHSAGFAPALLQSGEVKLNEWGTDLDVLHCLGDDLTDGRDIQCDGIHVLSAIEAIAQDASVNVVLNIKAKINEALNSLQRNNVDGQVSLRIPANCGNHWRLIKIEIDEHAIQSVELWDSFSSGGGVNYESVLNNLQRAIDGYVTPPGNITVSSVFAGVQTNSHSCMDFVLQEALRGHTGSQEIQDAKNDQTKLRIAVIRQIAKNHVELGETVANSIAVNGNVVRVTQAPAPAIPKILDDAERDDFAEVLQHDKHRQEMFDEIFARKLQKLYLDAAHEKVPSEENKDENIEKRAFQGAYKDFGFFLPANHKRTSSPTSGKDSPKKKTPFNSAP